MEEEALEVDITKGEEEASVAEAGAAFVEAEEDGVMVVETGAGEGEAVAGAGAVVAGEGAGVGGEVASGEDTDHDLLLYYVFDFCIIWHCMIFLTCMKLHRINY